KISRRHCTIFHDGTRFYVMDESTNGTKINDEDLTRGEMTEIFQNDEISLAYKAFFRLVKR
ncbi:MAG: FHA domain-containing protein, partial [Pyrinomonadaceae bacterium]|nr:FHA domain-containing protein [Pyrinomonadaceae bacterium]